MKYAIAIAAVLLSLNAAAADKVASYDTVVIMNGINVFSSNQQKSIAIGEVNSTIRKYQRDGYQIVELKNGETAPDGSIDITSEIQDAAGLNK